MRQVLLPLHLTRLLKLRTYRWEKVLYNIVFPVTDLSIALDFALLLVIVIVDVQAGVVSEVSESDFVEAFEEHMVCGWLARSPSRRRC